MVGLSENLHLVEVLICVVIGLITFFMAKKRALYPLHMLQLEGYDNEEYKHWIEENKGKIHRLVYKKSSEEKTPLVMTDRAKRLYQSNNILTVTLILVVMLVRFGLSIFNAWPTIFAILAFFAIYYFQYIVVAKANDWNAPKEKAINDGFYNSAQNKILALKEQNNLQVVGITGSFGKTSTKFITNTILSESISVQNTPSSYNTPMGLSKIINNELDATKEVFLAELGAKIPGEIAEVAELVQPNIGVITAIGPTHMHLFKTIENIQKTKYELIESLGPDGISIFNYDNDYVKPLADKTEIRKVLYGMENIENLDVYAKDIEVGERGSTFTLGIKGMGEISTTTSLLGAHNISNVLAGASIGYVLGMTLEDLANGIQKVEPVEHRLNIVDGGTGVIVIDDAFNSNPVGARAALDVLGAFQKGKKIIVTPGMVELGDMEEEENFKLGEYMANVVDYAILVGPKRTKPIQEGLKKAGFPEGKMIVSLNLSEATQALGGITAVGDVVLFENDLPDSYNEE